MGMVRVGKRIKYILHVEIKAGCAMHQPIFVRFLTDHSINVMA